MRKYATLCCALFAGLTAARAQTTLYSQNFNSGSASEWTLNTTDLGGDNSMSLNYWIINDVYAGSPPLIANTPNQPSGITGSPNSYYMHITSALGGSLGAENCSFQTSAGSNSFMAVQNTPIVTTGYTNVNISFWWICRGNASAVGQLYYRTSSTGAWTQVSTASTPAAPIDSFNMASSWTQYSSVHLADFDNQAFLEFAYRFKHGATGQDPAFGVDEIEVKGTGGASVPTPSFTATPNPVCQDSCITFTNTTVGATDSIRWMIVGAPYTSTVTPAYQLCIPSVIPAGTYTMRLYVFKSGAVDSVDHSFTVNPAPHPVIVRSANTFSVTGTYTGYQWYNGTTAIAGATNAGYTTTVKGSYKVIVDSGGCKGTATYSTLGVGGVNGGAQAYWVNQAGGNMIGLYASEPVDEPLNVSVFDATGRNLLSEVWTRGATDKQIDAGFYAPGLYYIKITGQGNTTTLRWLKQ